MKLVEKGFYHDQEKNPVTVENFLEFVQKLKGFKGKFSAIRTLQMVERFSKHMNESIIMMDRMLVGDKSAISKEEKQTTWYSAMQEALDQVFKDNPLMRTHEGTKYYNLVASVLNGTGLNNQDYDIYEEFADAVQYSIIQVLGHIYNDGRR